MGLRDKINLSTWQDDLKKQDHMTFYIIIPNLSSPHPHFPLEISSGTQEQGKPMAVATYIAVKIEAYTW